MLTCLFLLLLVCTVWLRHSLEVPGSDIWAAEKDEATETPIQPPDAVWHIGGYACSVCMHTVYDKK